MEKYKKKSLNFMGFSRELRKTDIENKRYASRLQRFSIIRMLDENESITEETKETTSRIPTIGNPKDQASSRIQMLQKWKQEKMVKKQQESKLRKPAFKVGVIKPNPPPSIGSKPLFALDTSSRFFKSSLQVSNSQSFSKKQGSLNASNSKTIAKVSNSQTSAKKTEVDTVNIKTSTKGMKSQSSISKIVVPRKPETKSTKNKESGIQFLNMKPKVDLKSKVVNKDQLSSNRKQPTIGSKPPLETKKESQLQPLNVRSKITSSVRDAKYNIPSSGLPKATASRTPSTEPKQIPSSGLPKATASRTLSTEPKLAIPKKNNAVKSIPKFSKPVAIQQKGNISEKTSRSQSKVPSKPESDCLAKPNKVATFECELSQIEPVKEQRKSFAPPGFMFQPPVELNSSLFLEDGPSAIFLRMKNQFLRTSTPKQSPSSQKSSSETEDSKCLENEDIKSAKDEEKIEEAQCSKNADNKSGSSHKYDLETLLSSSLESVFINDVKPIECKQSLKFNIPEVISTQNKDKVLLSSKIAHPELSLVRGPALGGAINPPILPDSDEIEKTEINSTDTRPADDNKITIPLSKVDPLLSEVIPDPTYNVKSNDCKQSLKCEFPEIVSAQNQEEVLLFSDITHLEHSLAKEPTLSGAINLSILPDSAEIEKTEINSTDPEGDSKITVCFPGVNSVSEIIPDPTCIVKPIECKQSIKFEFLEMVSTQKQEKVLLSSNITHPEPSLAREPTPDGAINLHIQPGSVEIDKTEINSTDSEGDSKITVPFPEVGLFVSEVMTGPIYFGPDENTEKKSSMSNGFLQRKENGLLKIPERKIRNFRRSEKPGLLSINESLENTPKSALKEKVLDSVFTPRRSSRLAKLSGNFRSLENLLDTPKLKENIDKAGLKDDFTPRRSLRLSKFSTEFSSAENLFDIRRPTLYGTPEEDEVVPKLNYRVTYDFDRLSSETEEETRPRNTRGGKVSLLYTPPNKSRTSIMRRSIKGDLMSFSPNA